MARAVLVGLHPGIARLLRPALRERTAGFAQTQQNLAAAGKTANFLEIFSPSMLRTTISTCLLSTGAQGGYYAITTWLPTFLRTERKLTILGTGGYLAVIIIGSLVGGCSAPGSATGSGGVRVSCCSRSARSRSSSPTPDSRERHPDAVLGFPLGFFSQGVFSGMGPFLTELFPTRMRGSGHGFT